VTPHSEYSLFFKESFFGFVLRFLSDGKIKQCVCIKFSMKLGKSTTKILEMLREIFGEYSLSRTVFFE
jgi:hypothetical protein